jgi:uncharacterized protein YabN with tetrapyrrole methylase and pyrophosphatase domain
MATVEKTHIAVFEGFKDDGKPVWGEVNLKITGDGVEPLEVKGRFIGTKGGAYQTRLKAFKESVQGDYDKEVTELREEIASFEKAGAAGDRARMEAELGDLLFCVCNVAKFLKVNPEDALRGTLARFESRFRHVEDRLREQGRAPQDATLDEMDRYWNEAKAKT